MRIAIAAALLALAACGPSPEQAAKDKEAAEAREREAMGQDDPNIPFDPQPPGPPRTYEAMSKTAMSFTPGALTLTPTAQKSENLPPGAVFAFGNGYTLETTEEPGGSTMGPSGRAADWKSIFIDPTGAEIDIMAINMYSVDKETIPKGAPNGGFCKKTDFLATYLVKSPGAEDLTIAAFDTEVWPPKDETALCGTFTYSIVH